MGSVGTAFHACCVLETTYNDVAQSAHARFVHIDLDGAHEEFAQVLPVDSDNQPSKRIALIAWSFAPRRFPPRQRSNPRPYPPSKF